MLKANSVDNVSLESIKELAGKIDKIETEIGALSHRADSTAFVGEGLKSVQNDLSEFKQNVFGKTNSIEQKFHQHQRSLKDKMLLREFHKRLKNCLKRYSQLEMSQTKAFR